jgi:hypothetical protein
MVGLVMMAGRQGGGRQEMRRHRQEVQAARRRGGEAASQHSGQEWQSGRVVAEPDTKFRKRKRTRLSQS